MLLLLTFIILFMPDSAGFAQHTADTAGCGTRYPVMFVHGFAYRDDIRLKRYWGDIPEQLRGCGAKVFLSHHNAFGTYSENAAQIRERVLAVLDSTGAEKVNLIGHSKGGLDARYMITHLSMDTAVASLTTIATPHRGAALANIIIGKLTDWRLIRPAQKLVHRLALRMGDTAPNPVYAGLQLTPEYMEGFNARTPDKAGVYYQSFCGVISDKHPGLMQRIKYDELYEADGPHDGTISVASSQWGRFRGAVGKSHVHGVSHFEIVGQLQHTRFDAPAFYREILQDLRAQGY